MGKLYNTFDQNIMSRYKSTFCYESRMNCLTTSPDVRTLCVHIMKS